MNNVSWYIKKGPTDHSKTHKSRPIKELNNKVLRNPIIDGGIVYSKDKRNTELGYKGGDYNADMNKKKILGREIRDAGSTVSDINEDGTFLKTTFIWSLQVKIGA